MELRVSATLQARLEQLARDTGRPASELVEDAINGYMDQVDQVRHLLDSRYDDLKSGRVKPVDGEEAFARLEALAEERRKLRA